LQFSLQAASPETFGYTLVLPHKLDGLSLVKTPFFLIVGPGYGNYNVYMDPPRLGYRHSAQNGSCSRNIYVGSINFNCMGDYTKFLDE
jgi:hypothetical protein